MFNFFKKKTSNPKANADEVETAGTLEASEEVQYTPEEIAKMNAYLSKYKEEDTPGWSAINARLDEFYDGREPDLHMGTLIKWMLGGPDPLDGVSAYIRRDPIPHIHYISYGLTSLYHDKTSAITEYSKWGFELTFRLRLDPENIPSSEDAVPRWPVVLMQNYARYVFKTGNAFLNGQYLNAQNSLNNDDLASDIHGNIFLTDPELGHIETPHGKVEFLQIIGATKEEVAALTRKDFVGLELGKALKDENPLLITDMNRAGNAMQ